MITSKDNTQLKLIRKLLAKRRDGLFVAEGEDLVDAAAASGWEPEILLRAGEDVEPHLLDAVSTLGSGTRVIGVYRERWSQPGGALSVWLDGIKDPGNVGTILRSALAFGANSVALGPDCADPFGPKAVRASMGSIFARPPARVSFESLTGTTVALDQHADHLLREVEVEPPIVLCVGSERTGLPDELNASARARIPLREDGPDSLNAAVSAAIALYRMAADA